MTTPPDKKGEPGRPSKFTAANREAILQAIQLGMPAQMAPQVAGVSYQTYREWIRAGELGREHAGGTPEEFKQFSEAVKKAEGVFVRNQLAVIEKAARGGTWQASAWKLERRYPDTFGRKFIHHEHTGEVKMTVEEAEQGIRAKSELLRRHGLVPERSEKGNGKGGNGARSN